MVEEHTIRDFLEDTKTLPLIADKRTSIEVRQGDQTLFKTLLNEGEKYFEMVDRAIAAFPSNPVLYGFDFDGETGLIIKIRENQEV